MYTARIVVLANARRLAGIAARLVNGSDDNHATVEPVLQQPAIDALAAKPVTEVTTRIPDMKCRANKRAMRLSSIGAGLFSTLLAMACGLSPVQIRAAEDSSSVSGVATVGPAKSRFLPLGIGKSVVIDLPREAKDVLVADPKIANAIILSAPTSSAPGLARPTWCSSMPTVSRSPATTSRSSATSTVFELR